MIAFEPKNFNHFPLAKCVSSTAAISNFRMSEKLLKSNEIIVSNIKNNTVILKVCFQKKLVFIFSRKVIILIFHLYDVYRDRVPF